MLLRARVWGVGKVLAAFAVLVATFFVFAAVGMRVALRAREVQVPDVVGRPVSEASVAMTDRGLTLRVDDNRRNDAKIPAGRIRQQDPPAGAQARRQRTVRVWLSAGVRTTLVPGLVGQTERTARIRLEQEGLSLGGVTEFRSPDYPPDAVVAQAPPPASPGDHVSLLINRGEQTQTFVMPDLVGVDGGRGSEWLRSHGFRVTVTAQPAQGIPPGTVVRQQPPSGFRVGPADAISLEVSR